MAGGEGPTLLLRTAWRPGPLETPRELRPGAIRQVGRTAAIPVSRLRL